MFDHDTIIAISTPPGRGGIGVVRVSGARAREVVAPMLRLRHELKAGRARFGEILEVGAAEDNSRSRFPSGMTNRKVTNENDAPAALDEAVVTFFAGPHSYTGEDVVEIAMHGAPVLLEYVVRQCCAGGARLAEAGEFTQRAFLAGRIDLTQAEAVDDLIGSSTLEQARVAARQLGGGLARVVAPLKAELVGLIAALEAGIDFAEDDIDVMAAEQIVAKLHAVRGPLVELERSFAFGRVVREGFSLALVGRPNAGKSSLFNRLVERERAIVTAMPGTTRDTVSETVSMDGIPVELIDTAGLREAADGPLDLAERMGIARSREAMAEADVVVVVVDGTIGAVDDEFQEMAGRAVILAWNKCDLVLGETQQSGRASPDKPRSTPTGTPAFAKDAKDGPPDVVARPQRVTVSTSAVTGAGIAELRAAIVEAVGGGAVREAGMLTNLRQHQAVETALRGLEAAESAVGAGTPHEMVLLDLYAALGGLDALTGVTTNEDVLRLIFSQFCIGK